MNLKDLYAATPIARHADIRVVGNQVLVKNEDGALVVYQLETDESLWLVPPEKTLGDLLTLLEQVADDVKKIKDKVKA
jgi:hypothetical protein